MLLALWCAFTGLVGLPQMRVAVNIPAYRLDVYVADSLTRSMPIAVGMPNFRTPRGEFLITSVEWNPWWIPPDRPWAARERPTPPGPTNPMRRVKINFRPLYFLHGTPAEASVGSAASHGCIRMTSADAIELAGIVHRYGSDTLTPGDVDRLAADTVTTRLLELDRPIPLEIRYDLAEIRAGRLSVYRDIYDLATLPLREQVYSLLAAHGVDTTMVDSARVRALIQRVPRGGNSVALDSLTLPGSAHYAPAHRAPPPARRRS